jgi:hypothetical protein
MRLASIAVLAVAAALAAGLQSAGAIHNDRYCMRSDCSYHTMKQCLASAWTRRTLLPEPALAWASAGWPIAT